MHQHRLVPALAVALVGFPAFVSTVFAQDVTRADRMALRESCGAEIKQLCPGAKPGGGAIMSCVRSKKDQLSPTCSSALEKIKAEKAD